ncbi:hypothetical protein PoB_002498100 [Plakobranchus ocellatus]|uniref:Uncharacterized protein n=1 Tax=Plakobranchus ocellatus TaxID=259542 RepID=A0AAV3ZR86_9GAST|nr:hypothetical protein PoB_002498100 [Plakobranchus ocellatus]
MEEGMGAEEEMEPTMERGEVEVGAIRGAVEGGTASPADFGRGCYMPTLKAFMDDTMILCSKENETRRMLVR